MHTEVSASAYPTAQEEKGALKRLDAAYNSPNKAGSSRNTREMDFPTLGTFEQNRHHSVTSTRAAPSIISVLGAPPSEWRNSTFTSYDPFPSNLSDAGGGFGQMTAGGIPLVGRTLPLRPSPKLNTGFGMSRPGSRSPGSSKIGSSVPLNLMTSTPRQGHLQEPMYQQSELGQLSSTTSTPPSAYSHKLNLWPIPPNTLSAGNGTAMGSGSPGVGLSPEGGQGGRGAGESARPPSEASVGGMSGYSFSFSERSAARPDSGVMPDVMPFENFLLSLKNGYVGGEGGTGTGSR
jgi:hypothetical protein